MDEAQLHFEANQGDPDALSKLYRNPFISLRLVMVDFARVMDCGACRCTLINDDSDMYVNVRVRLTFFSLLSSFDGMAGFDVDTAFIPYHRGPKDIII